MINPAQTITTSPTSQGDKPGMHDLIINEDLPNYTDIDRDNVLPLITEDLQYRRDFGLEKYGTFLQEDNGRDPVLDAYHEVLDLIAYLKQATRTQCHDMEWGNLRFLLSRAILLSMSLRKLIRDKAEIEPS